jgi:hypothetical protein
MAGLVVDPEAEKRSVMMRQKVLCNGEKNGRSCVHYWAHVEKVESTNADYLRRGEIYRVCGFHPSIAHEMRQDQLAVECNYYTPRRLPIWKRPLALLKIVDDPGRFDPSFEGYNPLTDEEIKQLQDQLPSTSPVIAELRNRVAQAQKPEVTLAQALGDDTEPGEGIFAKED